MSLLFLTDNVDKESKEFFNSKSLASECCLPFARFLQISAWCRGRAPGTFKGKTFHDFLGWSQNKSKFIPWCVECIGDRSNVCLSLNHVEDNSYKNSSK